MSSVLIFGLLFMDGMINSRAFFDLSLMKAIQRIDFAGISEFEDVMNYATGSPGIFYFWGAFFMLFVLLRQWATAAAFMLVPPTALINFAFGMMVERTRPHLPELTRSSQNWEERSFPSGHTQAGIMVFGFIFFAAAHIHNDIVRWTVRVSSLVFVIAVPISRIWSGAHWPTDVMAGTALGLSLLFPIMWGEERLRRAWAGLPLIHAGRISLPAGFEAKRALTSTVLFDRTTGTVTKIYRPGIVPRIMYWAAFQAPFGYERNRQALDAAVARRNLARSLTEYWYGTPRVAEAVGIGHVDGRLGLVSSLVEGRSPRDRHGAKAFLVDLRAKFEATGLPTWQIDPRQPRAIDNILETVNGYTIVDLESGLVAPIASRVTWRRAFQRGQVPMYDDVHVDVTRAYVDAHAVNMTNAHGEAWLADLRRAMDETERTAVAWYATELRLWSKLVIGLQTGFGYRTWPSRMQTRLSQGQDVATGWISRQVEQNVAEGRLRPATAAQIQAQVGSAEFQKALPYLGGHVAMSIVLRFPFGSIARAMMVLGALAWSAGLLVARRSDRTAFGQAFRLHSPRVVLVSAIPGIGTFAYLLSPAVQSDVRLIRILTDSSLIKVPWNLYERTGLRRWVALPYLGEIVSPSVPAHAPMPVPNRRRWSGAAGSVVPSPRWSITVPQRYRNSTRDNWMPSSASVAAMIARPAQFIAINSIRHATTTGRGYIRADSMTTVSTMVTASYHAPAASVMASGGLQPP